MNSYPIELLAQHAPLMFVAGLDRPPVPAIVSPPAIKLADTPSSHSLPSSKELNHDPFASLISRLSEALVVRSKGIVWEPQRGNTFHIVLVDKAVRFPPRKILPTKPSGEPLANGVPHSPLSPLTPSSPLFPDGLIAPIWVRKHIELVPSVFVLFLRVWEAPPPLSPLEGNAQDRDDERRHDIDLASEIAVRKKSTSERGIKLTVVLLASRRTLDDPALDTRLTFIRRQSGLDSRAALFVLSPVSPSELAEFVRSLQDALHEPAMEYYTSHSKRVRRKRNRHNHNSVYGSAVVQPQSSIASGRPLRSAGWMVRYEYKLATFAEFRAEEELARKHYEDCWTALVEMFGSTAILPPRTKRWAEAKVLADCITIKICKLYLYHNEHSLALTHFNRHLAKFSELSRGWGIGEETFEYWSWMARQYRILGELLEQGLRSTLKLPSLFPPPPPPAIPPTLTSPPQFAETVRSVGLNPSTTLQHPGFYYYTAALFTKERQDRFLRALENEQSPSAPGFANEGKVDHQTLILELYTRAYELFKKHGPGQNRLTLYIAYRIAETYYSASKFDSAVRFFERIAKTYRKEKWGSMLSPMISMWLECARQLGDIDTTAKLLIEMLAPGARNTEVASIEQDLLAILKTTNPSSPGPFIVDLSESEQIFEFSVVFWNPNAVIGEPAPFQLSIGVPSSVSISSLPFESLAIHFSDDRPPVVVYHAVEPEPDTVQLVRLSSQTTDFVAHLRWAPNGMIIFEGSVTSDFAQDLRISQVVLTLAEGNWKIQLPFDPCSPRIMEAQSIPRWFISHPLESKPRIVPIHQDRCWCVTVRPKPHLLAVALNHQAPACLNEMYPIIIEIESEDDRQLDITVDILLQPAEDDSVNQIIIEEETSTTLIKGVQIGTISKGNALSKTLYLISTGGTGERVLDISIQSRAIAPDDAEPLEHNNIHDTIDHLHTIVVPTISPFNYVFQTLYHRVEPLRPILDLEAFDGHSFEPDVQATVTTKIVTATPWDLEIESVKMRPKQVQRAQLLHCSIPTGGQVATVWQPGDSYMIVSRIDLSLGEAEELEEDTVDPPAEFEIMWKRVGSLEKITTTVVNMPVLRPPRDGVIVLVDPPPTARMHVPFALKLTIQNRHLFRTIDLTLQLEPSEAFVTAGLKAGQIPMLLPNTSQVLTFNLIPLTCGNVRLPNFVIRPRRKPPQAQDDAEAPLESEVGAVSVVDVRWDARDEGGKVHAFVVQDSLDGTLLREIGRDDNITVLVLP